LVMSWLRSLLQKSSNVSDIRHNHSRDFMSPLNSTLTPEPLVQTDIRDKKVRMRVRRSFKNQVYAMSARAMKPHSASCPDIFICKNSPCFIREPDKIVSGPYTVER
jgi:hypothetical protein